MLLNNSAGQTGPKPLLALYLCRPNVVTLMDNASSILCERDYRYFQTVGSLKRRTEFLSGRALLQYALLASGYEPQWYYDQQGLPKHPSVAISLSHSQGGCTVAIAEILASDIRVGVDIEYKVSRQPQAIAKQYFHPEEARTVAGNSGFFRHLWGLKEAYGKATRQGLAGGVLQQRFEISARQCREALAGGWNNATVALYCSDLAERELTVYDVCSSLGEHRIAELCDVTDYVRLPA